jgi:glycosyltransferase involved in cell wall biosynthesis
VRQPRIWVVSELYFPEETSTGHFITGIAEGLAATHPVSTLCGYPSYSLQLAESPAFEIRSRVRIHRCWATRLSRHNLFFRLINVLTFATSIFLAALMQVRRRDVVIVVTNPPILPFIVGLACRVKSAIPVLLVHDVYPNILVSTGMLTDTSTLKRLLGSAYASLMKAFRRIVVIGRDMIELLSRQYPACAERLCIIPNWADTSEVVPRDKEDTVLGSRLQLAGRLVVQYSGNMGRTHGLEDICKAAQMLQSQAPEILFLLIGSGAKHSMVKNLQIDAHLSNVVQLDRVERGQLADSLSACDVAIIAFIKGMSGLSVPSRMYNIMASGRPILAVADADSELARVVREENIGWVIEPGRPDLLVEALCKIRQSLPLLREMGVRARKVCEAKYTRQQVIERFNGLIAGLSEEGLLPR